MTVNLSQLYFFSPYFFYLPSPYLSPYLTYTNLTSFPACDSGSSEDSISLFRYRYDIVAIFRY